VKRAIPSATSSVQVKPPEDDELDELDELLEEDEDEELDEELEEEELDAPLEDDDDAPPELLEELPGVTPPFVQPCRATAPVANKMSAIFFI
jgi:hypothetical protein